MLRLFCASCLALALLSATPAAHARDGKKAGAIIAGALIGAAIVAATSHDHRHSSHRYHPSYDDRWRRQQRRERRRDQEYRAYLTSSFSPQPGVTCFEAQRACYKQGKGFSARWTRREFGG